MITKVAERMLPREAKAVLNAAILGEVAALGACELAESVHAKAGEELRSARDALLYAAELDDDPAAKYGVRYRTAVRACLASQAAITACNERLTLAQQTLSLANKAYEDTQLDYLRACVRDG